MNENFRVTARSINTFASEIQTDFVAKRVNAKRATKTGSARDGRTAVAERTRAPDELSGTAAGGADGAINSWYAPQVTAIRLARNNRIVFKLRAKRDVSPCRTLHVFPVKPTVKRSLARRRVMRSALVHRTALRCDRCKIPWPTGSRKFFRSTDHERDIRRTRCIEFGRGQFSVSPPPPLKIAIPCECFEYYSGGGGLWKCSWSNRCTEFASNSTYAYGYLIKLSCGYSRV